VNDGEGHLVFRLQWRRRRRRRIAPVVAAVSIRARKTRATPTRSSIAEGMLKPEGAIAKREKTWFSWHFAAIALKVRESPPCLSAHSPAFLFQIHRSTKLYK
jgi:hypothetical protein